MSSPGEREGAAIRPDCIWVAPSGSRRADVASIMDQGGTQCGVLGENDTSHVSPVACCCTLQVKSIEEEEYCLIPMGGVLPRHPQRVLGIGGTAGMVHPSTGEQAGALSSQPAVVKWLCGGGAGLK